MSVSGCSAYGGLRRMSPSARLIAACLLVVAAPYAVAEDHASQASTATPADNGPWWTGSLLSASAGTMPVGRWLVEPFVVDSISDSYFDANGNRHGAPRTENVGLAAYIMYGLLDGLSVGGLPRMGLREQSVTQGSSGLTTSDITILSQLRLTRFQEGGWIPATSLLLRETFPTGRYDRLSGGPNAGTGGGVHITEVAFYAQTLVRAYHDRPLRVRLNLTYGWSDSTSVSDSSVYGTPVGFHGRARPGPAITAVSAWEYSFTRNWVLALDVVYQHQDNIHVAGYVTGAAAGANTYPLQTDSGPSESWSFAPALEYNFNRNIGVIAGAKFTGWGRNASSVLVPAVAINMFF